MAYNGESGVIEKKKRKFVFNLHFTFSGFEEYSCTEFFLKINLTENLCT